MNGWLDAARQYWDDSEKLSEYLEDIRWELDNGVPRAWMNEMHEAELAIVRRLLELRR